MDPSTWFDILLKIGPLVSKGFQWIKNLIKWHGISENAREIAFAFNSYSWTYLQQAPPSINYVGVIERPEIDQIRRYWQSWCLYPKQGAAETPKQETILVPQPKSESRPAALQTQLPTPAKPPLPVTPPTKVIKEIDPPAGQPTLTDFGLYKCEFCGKIVIRFEKVNHEQEKHGGKSVEWKKVR